MRGDDHTEARLHAGRGRRCGLREVADLPRRKYEQCRVVLDVRDPDRPYGESLAQERLRDQHDEHQRGGQAD